MIIRRARDVSAEQLPVVGMRAFFDELFRAFPRTFPAQVGDALFRDDDVHVVFRVVGVRAHRNNGGNRAAFGDGRAGENRQIRVAREIAGAADAVHHLPPVEVRGIDVPEQIDLNRRVHADETEPAHDSRIVGDFLRAKNDFVLVEIEVLVNVLQAIVGDGERAAAHEQAAPRVHQLDDGILDDFRVHAERRDFRVAPERGEHGVGDVADARLNREKFLRKAAVFELVREKIADVLADFVRHGIARLERRDVVVFVREDDADDLRGIDLEHRRPDAVLHVRHRNRRAVRRVERHVNVVQILQPRMMIRVELDDDAVRELAVSRRVPAGGRERNLPVVRDFRRLDERRRHARDEPVAHVHRRVRKVHVVVAGFLRIDVLAQIRVGLIRRAEIDRVRLRENAVRRRGSRRPGKQVDFERAPGRMLRLRFFGERARDRLRRAGGGEAAETDVFAVPDESGGFFWTESSEFHGCA